MYKSREAEGRRVHCDVSTFECKEAKGRRAWQEGTSAGHLREGGCGSASPFELRRLREGGYGIASRCKHKEEGPNKEGRKEEGGREEGRGREGGREGEKKERVERGGGKEEGTGRKEGIVEGGRNRKEGRKRKGRKEDFQCTLTRFGQSATTSSLRERWRHCERLRGVWRQRVDSAMANRRRQAASVTGTEKPTITSPARRSNRRRAAVENAQCGESPCSENRAEERSLYKTPKRTQVSRSRLPTFNSPTNEIDMQQEIFWDPQSPTTYKLGNSQKKLTVGRHTVEISEIVNRIAPQDEKPACYEGSLLGLWIGEDAIPCTPGITKVRSRTKINTARVHQLKHGEEELMKLAKQFDKNLIDAKVMNGKPIVKSTDFAPSEKEYKSRRCSQEEIARKKQEALERRKCKMEALCKNAAPT
ncbi:ewing's tumor-associated antigen 1 [Crotalus adamanteus]|uniref:Ewing's tumor-associated antigen 1 n=1 Tax=Crotalus adamanteus TaxID=8729 RepID=A0AAW1C0V0_CROAD